ncbi:MAG: alpha-L-rhamnosidase N-terminal domain-containing protein [Armatimonadota bacterium]
MSGETDGNVWAPAAWIWHPLHEKMYNFHLLARKLFSLDTAPARATCIISANNSYELQINGRWIGRGPERSYPEWQYYDEYDVTRILRQGSNIVAVHAYNHGTEHTGTLHQSPGRGGLIAKIAVELANGDEVVVATDDFWRVLRAPQYSVDNGFTTQHREDYKEVYDAAKEPSGWELPDFDDSEWPTAEVLGPVPTPPWEHLIPRDIPHFTSEPVQPVNVFGHLSGSAYGFCEHDIDNPRTLACDDDEVAEVFPLHDDFRVQILLDFGRPVVGRFHLDVADCEGGKIAISYGEDLDLTRIDELLLRPGAQHYSPYERRYGRYVMLTCHDLPAPLKLRHAWFELVTYPVEEVGEFSCNDEMLNRIWDVGRWTLRMNMHDVFEDCPFREQTLYCGDLRVAALLAYYAFGDYTLARHSLEALARIQHENGGLPMRGLAPREVSPIPEFPALWLIALADYWQHSGEISLVEDLWDNVTRLLEWYHSWHDERGLMQQLPTDQRYDFVDNLAGIDQGGQVLAVQCIYHRALVAAQNMAVALEDTELAEKLQRRAGTLADAVNELYWDSSIPGYTDCLTEDGEPVRRATPDIESEGGAGRPLNQITNGLMLYCDLVPEERKAGALETLVNPGAAPPVRAGYMNFYVTEALFCAGRDVEAVRRIREYWGEMIARGATTFWEVFDPQTPPKQMPERLWSLCHPFCAGPVYGLPAHVLGVQPAEPGFTLTRIAPEPGDLRWARGAVPTPSGTVEVNWQRGDDGMRLQLEVSWPAAMAVELVVPLYRRDAPTVVVDGRGVDAEIEGTRAVINRPPAKNRQHCVVVTH